MEFKQPQGLLKKFVPLAQDVISQLGLALYDVEFIPGQTLLRLFIINLKTQTAQLEDCIKVDHALSPYFESEEWLPEELTLEVSSPGVYRKLTKPEHFKWAIGQTVAIVLFKNKSNIASGQLRGKLIAFADNYTVTMECDGQKHIIAIEDIKKAQLDPDFEEITKLADKQETITID